MFYPVETKETDVLIMGGGLAAYRSAIEVDENDVKVMTVMKAKFGQGGATGPWWHGSIAVPIGENDSPEKMFKDIMLVGMGMCDERLAQILAYDVTDRLHDLEKWGMEASGKVNGKYQQRKPRNIELTDRMSAPGGMRTVLKQQIEKRTIPVIDEVMVISLLTNQGACVGALGVDKNGKFLVFKAKSTILAVGGANGLFPPRYDAGITGDGYAAGFRAGAELYNMEFIQTTGSANDRERNWIPLSPLADIYNRLGERFLVRYLPQGVTPNEVFNQRASLLSANDPGKYWEVAAYKEVQEGRGPIYIDYSRLPRKAVEDYLEGLKQAEPISFYRRYGKIMNRLFDKPLECLPSSAHCFNGGLRINERAETTLPGLYAAGEVAAGPHGPNRLGGCMVAVTQVFGARAGRFAAERAKCLGEITVDQEQVDNECQGASSTMSDKGKITVTEIEGRIRDLMWRNCLTVRNQKGLESCLQELKRLRHEELPKLLVTDGAELFRALAIRNMLDVGEILAYAQLQRKESRGSRFVLGAHYREDYPERDDKNWLKVINISNKNLNLG